MTIPRLLSFGAIVAALAIAPAAFGFTVDNKTGNNPDGTARYAPPDQTLPYVSRGSAGWPGAYVRGDSYNSGDMLVPPYHPPTSQAPVPVAPPDTRISASGVPERR